MKRITTVLLCLLLSISAVIVVLAPVDAIYASNTTLAKYVGTVRISNNGTTANNVFTTLNLTTQQLIDGDWISDNCLNSALLTNAGADTAYMPAPGNTDLWSIYVPSILQNSNLDYSLYLGGSQDMDGKIRYFPGPGGMTTPDSASLELGDNFTIEQKGYIDTSAGSNKYLVYKQDAFSEYVNGGNITAEIQDALFSQWVTPTGYTDASGNWTGETYAYDDDTGTSANASGIYNGQWTGFLELSHGGVETESIRVWVNSTGDPVDTIDIDAYYDGVWNDVYQGAPTLGSWATYDLPGELHTVTNIRIQFQESSGSFAYPQIFEVDYGKGYYPSVTATGISSGEHLVTVNATPNKPVWATGNVLHFDGTANSNINAGAIYNAASKLWISFWFKLDQDFDSTVTQSQTIWGKYADGNNYMRVFLAGSNGRLKFAKVVSGSSAFGLAAKDSNGTEITSWAAGQWYHVIASISSSNGARFKVDDGTVATDTDNSTAPNGGDFVIGSLYDGYTSGFKGIIANVIVGTDDLTTNEEIALYSGEAPGDETDYWYIDEGSGATIYSYGSSGNNGTAGSATEWQTSTYTSGKTGRLCDFYIDINGSKWGSNLKGTSVPDNANSWTFLQNNVMPYMEYHKIWVDGTLKQHIEWENNDSVFTDLSGNGNDVTPTFRTTSSDPDVSATLVEFNPVSEAEATNWTLVNPQSPVTGTPTEPGNYYTELQNTDNVIFGAFWNDILDDGNVPRALFWLTAPFLIAIVFGMMVYFWTGSLIAQIIVMALILAGFSQTALPFWPVIIFIVDAVAIAIASKQFGWGG